MKAFHGTTRENADLIKAEGFRAGTYFAFRREHAEKFGPVVLEVHLSDAPELWHNIEPESWQFWLREDLPPSVLTGKASG